MTRATSGKQRKQRAADSSVVRSNSPLTIFVALFVCAFLWPSEGAIAGDGLHLSVLWLIALAGLSLWDVRQLATDETALLSKPHRSGQMSVEKMVTLGMGLLLVGVWVSTWNVFRASGDRRAALNLAFDWTAIAGSAWLCRHLILRPESRRAITHLVAGLSVGLAAYGIWQSHAYYANEGQTYLDKRQILDEGTDPAAVARIRREFAQRQIPLAGPERRQFEQRLLNSTEPFGPFALANTLAGVLAVGVVLIAASLVAGWSSGENRRSSLVVPALLFAVVVWCLILTKSRTAWVGAALGLTLVVLLRPRSDTTTHRISIMKVLAVSGMVGVAAAVLFTVGLLTGVVDQEVILESPRSLQFRLFYWMGASGVIGNEPLLGAGPGNFRQLYLAHKPVESSESILDPHNLLLDAWCFAGVMGLVGILLLVFSVVRSLQKSQDPESAAATSAVSDPLGPGLAGCLLVHFGWMWLSGQYFGSQEIGLAAAVILAGVASTRFRRLTWNPVAPAAAAIALLVHLMGAGGLQITSLGFLLINLVLLALPAASAESAAASSAQRRLRRTKMLTAAGFAAMAGATLAWGMLPVKSASVQQAIGQQRLHTADIQGALRAFQQGAEADPLSPVMRQQIVQAAAYSLMQRSPPNEDVPSSIPDQELEMIESACREAIRCDERAIGGRLSRARIYQQLDRLTGESEYIETSVRDLRNVVQRHPTNAALQVERAVCEQSAGNSAEAREAAEQALRIEAVNQSWGHSDQYLSDDQLKTLEQIINGETQ